MRCATREERHRQRAVDEWADVIRRHDTCRWETIGPCVHCAEHRVHLYEGSIPPRRDQQR